MIYGGSDTSAFLAQQLALGPRLALYNGHLWLRSIKIEFDGAMGSRGAALLEPYTDDPGNVGLFRIPPAEVERIAVLALQAGFQMCTHAIGDRANRVALDIYASALRQVPTADHRFRIEHAQLLTPQESRASPRSASFPRCREATRPATCHGSRTASGRSGAVGLCVAIAARHRRHHSQRFRCAGGVDQPAGLVPFVHHETGCRQSAPGGWFPEQRLTREEALLGMTQWPAYASFMENEVGSLSAGKYADFVILDQDIMTVPAEQVLATRVLRTVLGGKTVYEQNGNSER